MPTIGNILKETRQQKGMSLFDIEELTKIRTRYLKALEEDDYNLLPGETYVVGFLKSYANALGLDARGLVDRYKNMLGPREEHVRTSEKIEPVLTVRQPIKRGILIVGLCLLAVLTLVGANSIWKSGETSKDSKVKADGIQQKDAKITTGSQASASQPTASGQQAQQQSGTATPAKKVEQLSLVMNFSADCWVQVKVDGKEVYNDIFTKGVTKTVTAADKIELKVGYTPGLQLVLNGKAQPTLVGNAQGVATKVYTKADVQ